MYHTTISVFSIGRFWLVQAGNGRLSQELSAAEIVSGDVDTVAGPPVSVNVDDATGNVTVSEATVVQADVQASNGVIHAIDQVLLPPDVQL